MALKRINQIAAAFLCSFKLKQRKKNWQRIAIQFFFAVFAFVLLLRFVPIPFSAYMAQQQIGLRKINISLTILGLTFTLLNVLLSITKKTNVAFVAVRRFLSKLPKIFFYGTAKVGYAKG